MERSEGRDTQNKSPRSLFNNLRDRLRGSITQQTEGEDNTQLNHPEDVALYGLDLQFFPFPQTRTERTLPIDSPPESSFASAHALDLAVKKVASGGTISFPGHGVILTAETLREQQHESESTE